MKQDQIGEKGRPAPLQLPGRSLELLSNGQPRGMVVTAESSLCLVKSEDLFSTDTETGLQTAQVYFDFVPATVRRLWP